MRFAICFGIHSSRWTTPRETIGRHRICHSQLEPAGLFLSKVDRIRGELATGCYPLENHIDALLEPLLGILS